ncbi:hypothetical protein KIN20_013567 [Parelaphostrongylus tenuis]|uniref:Uncharacterized protein n=1 Tax=Parelaphostrongylus tenuis TaxID=148309 RepID=A0AAD5MXR8_PARTN|nr:hypothetical protein KIN20_013567 [Parelaphostrongylus tenuis]
MGMEIDDRRKESSVSRRERRRLLSIKSTLAIRSNTLSEIRRIGFERLGVQWCRTHEHFQFTNGQYSVKS